MSELCDLLKIREALGKSQSEFAELLGVSVRAIQSYEQGWRDTPPLVQKMAVLLMLLQHQQTCGKVQPCSKVNGCSAKVQADCRGAQLGGGHFCWIVTGNKHEGKELKSWDAKAAKCRKCDFLKQWMPA